MIRIDVPGGDALSINHLVMDYNGTLALDGRLLPGIFPLLEVLSGSLSMHILTADTFGSVQEELKGFSCNLEILSRDNQAQGKLDYILKLNEKTVVAIGNGKNDRLMLEKAGLGIAVIQQEGAFSQTIAAADVVCFSIMDALNLLINPSRLTATLRS